MGSYLNNGSGCSFVCWQLCASLTLIKPTAEISENINHNHAGSEKLGMLFTNLYFSFASMFVYLVKNIPNRHYKFLLTHKGPPFIMPPIIKGRISSDNIDTFDYPEVGQGGMTAHEARLSTSASFQY